MPKDKNIPLPTCNDINDESVKQFLKFYMKSIANNYGVKIKYVTSQTFKNTSQYRKTKRSSIIVFGEFDNIMHELISLFYELARISNTSDFSEFYSSLVHRDSTSILFEIHTDNINKALMLAHNDWNILFSFDVIHWLLDKLMPCTSQNPMSISTLLRNIKYSANQNELDKNINQVLESKLLEFINCASIRNLIIEDKCCSQLYNNAMHLYANKKYPEALKFAINCMEALVNYHPNKVNNEFYRLQSSLIYLKSRLHKVV